MTSVDWVALVVIALAGLLGYRRGLIGSALSLAGVIVGAIVGARLAPHLLHGGDHSRYTPLAALVGATLGAAVLQTGGMLLGSFVRGSMRLTPIRTLDSVAGLVLGAAAGLAVIWVLGAVALLLPGNPRFREAAQRSEILGHLNDAVPPRRLLNALARIDPLPSLAALGAPPAPPDATVSSDPQIAAAAHSVLRITGTACGVGVEGSGWVAGHELVVTAAHVVAGQTDTQVENADGSQLVPAQVVVFDARNDIAVLRVSGLDVQPLRLADPRPGSPGALIGYPGNGALTATPVRVGRTSTVLSQDAYGRGPLTRMVTLISGTVRHGDSGGPVVDRSGAVQATVFASREGSPSGFAVPSDLVRHELEQAGGPVSTSKCAQ